MFYLTTHSTHFIYSYMASDIWLRTILIVRKETSCRHIGYSYRLTARILLYAPSHRQDSTYHSLCYTSRGALAGARNSSMGPPVLEEDNRDKKQTVTLSDRKTGRRHGNTVTITICLEPWFTQTQSHAGLGVQFENTLFVGTAVSDDPILTGLWPDIHCKTI